MAFTSDGNVFSTSSKTAANNIVVTTGVAIAAGKIVVVCVAKDNQQTNDSQSNEITGCSDSQGNTYTKIGEFTNGQGSSAAGATVAAFFSKLTTALGTTDTITASFNAFVTAKAIMGCSFGVSGGSSVQLAAGSLQTLASDAANPPAMTISGLANKEYLFVRCIAHENNGTGIIVTSGYSSPDTNGIYTTGGNSATNMGANMEFRILTATGDSSDPNITTQDQAAIYFALEEVVGVPQVTPAALASASQLGSPTITAHAAVAPANLTSASQLGSPTMQSGSTSLTPNSLTSASALGVPALIAHAVITGAALVSASQLSVPVVTAHAAVSPASLVSASQLGSPALAWRGSLSPAGLTSLSQLSSPAPTAHAVLSPAALISLSQLSTPTLAVRSSLSPASLISASQLGSGALVPPLTFTNLKGVAQGWLRDQYQLVFHPRQIAP